ncbi:hypothetical protein D1007_43645 [Hordeum vulgare]|nr:hypothetical protein D1007_43645 [Hordeum vulgare]
MNGFSYKQLSLHNNKLSHSTNEMKYQVGELGGTNRDDHSYGGASLEVHLKTKWCQCERPSKYQWPCSHLITAAKAAHIAVCDGKTVRMQEFHVEATRLTWAPRFHPFLDQSQWPEYHGTHIKPDPLLMVETKGRRRTKRFRGDMDDLAGYTGMNQFGSGHFMEAPDTIDCGVCDEGRHNTQTCKKRKMSNGGIPSSSSRGMASSGSMTRPPCADQEDMPKTWKEAELDKIKEKDVPTPQCWCGVVCKSPLPLCKCFTWIDQEVPECVQGDQHRDAKWRQCLFNEALAREEERERREKEKKESKKREDEKCKEKKARKEERERKLARARDAQAEDEARDKKGKWPCTTQ